LEFAAHARTDIPKLLDSLEAARRELAAAHKEIADAKLYMIEADDEPREWTHRDFSHTEKEGAGE
jgi:hypothetical protein